MPRPVVLYRKILKPILRYEVQESTIVVHLKDGFNWDAAMEHLYIGAANVEDEIFTPAKFSEILIARDDFYFIVKFPKYFERTSEAVSLKFYFFPFEDRINRVIARVFRRKPST